PLRSEEERWVAAAAADLRAAGPAALVAAGEGQAAAVHALAHAMNGALGAAGSTVVYTEPAEPLEPLQLDSLRELVREMAAGQVDTLLILGGNPVYTAPADLAFEEALRNVRLRIHHSLYHDETSFLCHWHLPEAHYLES